MIRLVLNDWADHVSRRRPPQEVAEHQRGDATSTKARDTWIWLIMKDHEYGSAKRRAAISRIEGYIFSARKFAEQILLLNFSPMTFNLLESQVMSNIVEYSYQRKILLIVGSCATKDYKPRQVRKEAAVVIPFVCRRGAWLSTSYIRNEN